MRRRVLLAAGVGTLALAWLGPLPSLAVHRFSAHMTMHMTVVAVAAPLLALALAGGPFDPVRLRPPLWNAIALSALELVVVWAWHAPVLHRLARESAAGLVAEQASFLAAGLLLWLAALGGGQDRDGTRAGSGVVALLLTSMHMTLLGALLALAPRALYRHDGDDVVVGAELASALAMEVGAELASARALEAELSERSALQEQQLGGVIMLLVGGVAYLAGGLGLSARLLERRPGVARSELR